MDDVSFIFSISKTVFSSSGRSSAIVTFSMESVLVPFSLGLLTLRG